MDPCVLIACLMTVSCCLWANVGQWVSKAYLMTVNCLGANVEPNSAQGVHPHCQETKLRQGVWLRSVLSKSGPLAMRISRMDLGRGGGEPVRRSSAQKRLSHRLPHPRKARGRVSAAEGPVYRGSPSAAGPGRVVAVATGRAPASCGLAHWSRGMGREEGARVTADGRSAAQGGGRGRARGRPEGTQRASEAGGGGDRTGARAAGTRGARGGRGEAARTKARRAAGHGAPGPRRPCPGRPRVAPQNLRSRRPWRGRAGRRSAGELGGDPGGRVRAGATRRLCRREPGLVAGGAGDTSAGPWGPAQGAIHSSSPSPANFRAEETCRNWAEPGPALCRSSRAPASDYASVRPSVYAGVGESRRL